MFNEHLSKHLASLTGSFIVTDEAERFIEYMRRHYEAELDAWLAERETWLVSQEIRLHLRSERARTQHHAGARAFAEHLSLDDVPEPDDPFNAHYCVNDDNVWKSLGDMTGADHKFVADKYEVRGKRSLTLAAFHRMVAERVGNKRTADVMDVETYTRLLHEIEAL